ncbi:FERM domain-containing protein 5, partial [Fasciola gigantica]
VNARFHIHYLIAVTVKNSYSDQKIFQLPSRFKHQASSGHSSPSRSPGGPASKLRKLNHSKESKRSRSTSLPPDSKEPVSTTPIAIDTPLDECKEDKNMTLFMVEVKLLSDEEAPLQLEVTNTCLGRALFNQVIERLNGIVAKDYFGLRYLDRTKQRQWLEMSKTVYKQLKYVSPRSLNFRVKHYPSNPLEEFTQEKTRYLLYLQLRRDLHSGRLIGRNVEMHRLAACILQAEIGDYDLLADYLGEDGTLADLKMFSNVTPGTEAKIAEFHKSLRGATMEEAENKFLELASKFETYGIEPLYVQDRKGNHFYMGLNHEGVVTFRGSKKAHVFSWKKLNVSTAIGQSDYLKQKWETRRHTLGFKCPTAESAEALWKWAVDRQCFFTLSRSVDAKESKANGGIFKRRQFYTFTGRCQKELMLLNSSLPSIPQPSVSRSEAFRYLSKGVRQSRQSKSQNDLDRQFGASTDSLPDGHLGSMNGLQRHKSVSDTRRNVEDEVVFSGTNQLGNQLGARLTVGINNSQSTPSLIQPAVKPFSEDSQSALVGKKPLEKVEQQNTPAQITTANEYHPILKRGQARTRVVDSTHANIGSDRETKKSTRQSGESTGRKAVFGGTLTPLSNEEPELSDLEQNAEATDQPAETGEALGNTGSVNTLSSSPLRSADEEGEQNTEEEEAEGEEVEEELGYKKVQTSEDREHQKGSSNQVAEPAALEVISEAPVNTESRPVASKRSTRPTGKWLGPGGIRPYVEAAELGQTEQDMAQGTNSMITRPRMNSGAAGWIEDGGDFAPPVPSSPPPFFDETVPIRSSGTVTISITPNILPSSNRLDTKTSIPSSRAVDSTTSTKRYDNVLAISQSRESSSPPPEFADAADVDEYIDSTVSSPPVGRVTAVTNKTRNHMSPAKYITEQTHTTNQNLYFPYARTVRLGGSTTRSRSQDYKALAAIPSKRSPTRRDIQFTRLPQSSVTDKSNKPQEISLSAENFTRAEPEQPLIVSTEPGTSARAELIERARCEERGPESAAVSRRSCDLSPQPRDWIYDQHQQQQRKNQTRSDSVNLNTGLSELIIFPSTERITNIENYMDRSAMSTSQPTSRTLCGEMCQHSAMHPCGLSDSTLPNWTLRQREKYAAELESPSSRASNDLLLNHGYAAQTQLSPKVEGFLEHSKASSSAAQLAAGASTRPYRTVSPVVGPSTSPQRIELKPIPVPVQSLISTKRPAELNLAVRVITLCCSTHQVITWR